MSKYLPLRDYLQQQNKPYIELSFEKIEKIIGSKLPSSAYCYKEWWANDYSHTQARNGWLAAGFEVHSIDLKNMVVVFYKKDGQSRLRDINNDLSIQRANHGLSTAVNNAKEFEEFARRIMSCYFGVELKERMKQGWPKKFDLVSPNYKIVGDAKYYTMVRGTRLPPAKFAIISEHVWLLEHIDADTKFLVFGNDKRVPMEWLKRYGRLNKEVKFFYLSNNGHIEILN